MFGMVACTIDAIMFSDSIYTGDIRTGLATEAKCPDGKVNVSDCSTMDIVGKAGKFSSRIAQS